MSDRRRTVTIPAVRPHVHLALRARADSDGTSYADAARAALTAGAMLVVPPQQLVARLVELSRLPTLRKPNSHEGGPLWHEYLDTIIAITRLADETVLDDLLAYFDDRADEQTLMRELLRGMLVSYRPVPLARAAVRAVPTMCTRAPEIARDLHAYIIVRDDRFDDAAFSLYLAEVATLGRNALAALRRVLADVAVDDEPGTSRLAKVRARLAGRAKTK